MLHTWLGATSEKGFRIISDSEGKNHGLITLPFLALNMVPGLYSNCSIKMD